MVHFLKLNLYRIPFFFCWLDAHPSPSSHKYTSIRRRSFKPPITNSALFQPGHIDHNYHHQRYRIRPKKQQKISWFDLRRKVMHIPNYWWCTFQDHLQWLIPEWQAGTIQMPIRLLSTELLRRLKYTLRFIDHIPNAKWCSLSCIISRHWWWG